MLRVNLFGSFQVNWQEKAITESFRTVKERALLAFLMVEHQLPHSREALAEFLWPDRPDMSARTNLRQALYGIRQAIETPGAPSFFITREDIVRFNTQAPYELDVKNFLERYYKILDHEHEQITSCETCNEHLASAVEAYRGEFLDGFSVDGVHEFQEWVSFQRETYFQKYLTALQHLVDFNIFKGEIEAAHHFAVEQVKAAPLEEKGYRQMMRLLSYLGRRSAAIEQYHTCQAVLKQEFDVEPSPKTKALYSQICEGVETVLPRSDQNVKTRPRPSMLPISLTSFIGRGDEIAQLTDCLQNRNCRLITLVGIGGIGKTRLAIEAARKVEEHFSEGVWFVPLHDVPTSRSLAEVILNKVGVRLSENTSVHNQFISYFRPLKTLIILDQYENWLDATPVLIDVLQHSPNVKFLITSRERVNYQAACLFDVGGLALPGDGEDPLSSDVVQLFLSRNQNRQGRQLNVSVDAEIIARLCRLLGGHPLAIELAAVQARSVSFIEMEEQLAVSLSSLQTSQHDVPERHRNLEMVYEKTWSGLSEMQRVVFSSASIFEGFFDANAFMAVAECRRETIMSLVDSSLVFQSDYDRFSMHPILKTFAREKLVQMPDMHHKVRVKHYQYYLGVLHRYSLDFQQGRDINRAINMIAEILRNIETAIVNAACDGELAQVEKSLHPLMDWYDLSSRLGNGQITFGMIENTLMQLPEDIDLYRVLGRAVAIRGWFFTRLGMVNEALESFSRASSLLSDEENARARPFMLFANGFLLRRMGRFIEARKLFERSKKLALQFEDMVYAALSELLIVEVDIETGGVDHALPLLEGVLKQFRKIGYLRGQVRTLVAMGDIVCIVQECARGKEYFLQALELVSEMDSPWLTAMILEKLGRVAVQNGAHEEALEKFVHSLNVFRRIGDQWRTISTLTELGEMALSMQSYQDAADAFAEALHKARHMDHGARLIRIYVGLVGLYAKSGEKQKAARLVAWLMKQEESCVSARLHLEKLSALLSIDLLHLIQEDVIAIDQIGPYSDKFVVEEFDLWRKRAFVPQTLAQ